MEADQEWENWRCNC